MDLTMTTFDTRVNGVPCKCSVVNYSKEVPMKVYGPGMGDCHPPEPEEFEFEILDRRGRRARWLDRYINEEVEMRLLAEFIEARAEYFTEPEYD